MNNFTKEELGIIACNLCVNLKTKDILIKLQSMINNYLTNKDVTMSNEKPRIKPAIESEKTVLGALLIDNTLFVGLNQQLCSDDFYLPFHKELFKSMCYLLSKNKRFDAPMIIDDLKVSKEHQPYLYELESCCISTKNIKAHADIIREKSVQRQLIKVAEEIAESATDKESKLTINQLLGNAEEKVLGISKNSEHFNIVQFLKEFTKEIEDAELTEDYLHSCIVEVNKAFVSTLQIIEEHKD